MGETFFTTTILSRRWLCTYKIMNGSGLGGQVRHIRCDLEGTQTPDSPEDTQHALAG